MRHTLAYTSTPFVTSGSSPLSLRTAHCAQPSHREGSSTHSRRQIPLGVCKGTACGGPAVQKEYGRSFGGGGRTGTGSVSPAQAVFEKSGMDGIIIPPEKENGLHGYGQPASVCPACQTGEIKPYCRIFQCP